MKKQTILLAAIGYFASHPSVDKFHFTSDEQAFAIEDHAIDQSRNLQDKTVTTVTRQEAADFEKEQKGGKAAGGETPKKVNYHAMKEADLFLEIEKRNLKFEKTELTTRQDVIAFLKADDESKQNP